MVLAMSTPTEAGYTAGYQPQTPAPVEQTTPKKRWTPNRASTAGRSSNVGRPGSKRFQRYMNKMYLLKEHHNVTVDDFGIYVVPNPTIFGQIFEGENRKIWDEFISLSETRQRRFLNELSSYIRKMDKQSEAKAHHSFISIEKSARDGIRKGFQTDFFLNLDKELSDYADDDDDTNSWIYTFEDSYQRLICHGICSYYRLVSRSQDDENGERVVVIKKCKRSAIPGECLADYLRNQQGRNA
eukprot:TRINITY_DN5012_c0_g1_i1.p2 TRINITY_DN5012_c0_g1~~TRINITY_DN5012_c0_g1_i1.p2  ORF type:complete len:241 (+),score=58.59 TRINITY_DN5012_c0_g1_i1:212-934(+)